MTPRLVMMGTGTFARPTFEAILANPDFDVVGLVTQPDREGGQQRGSTRQTGLSLKAIAVERGIPVYQPESVNTPNGAAQLREWNPDLLVVAAYGQILKNEVLQAARWGGINVHGSLLPKYRGAAPVAHAILNGETTTGVTIIRMTTGLDAGDMLAQGTLEIGPDETAGELEARLAPLGARLAVEVIERARNEEGISGLPATKQDPALVTKAPKLKKENGLIDWSQSAERIVNHIRAMQPWPTAYTFLRRANSHPLRVIIGKAIVCEPPASAGGVEPLSPPAHAGGSPGTVLNSGQRFFAIAGTRIVEILELQPAGKKRMSAAEFLRGHPIHEGDRFGPETLP
jgi:methionyl-tRNA formyltransferase